MPDQGACVFGMPTTITMQEFIDPAIVGRRKIVSEYDQETPQSQTAVNPVASRGRAAQPS